MKMLITLIVGISVTCISMDCAAQLSKIMVCYVPFHYETPIPVTPSSIFQEKCQAIGNSDSIAKNLLNIVLTKPKSWSGKPDFDFLFVRLEISRDGEPPLFIDQNGVVLVSNERYLLDASALSGIEKLLNARFGYPLK